MAPNPLFMSVPGPGGFTASDLPPWPHSHPLPPWHGPLFGDRRGVVIYRPTKRKRPLSALAVFPASTQECPCTK